MMNSLDQIQMFISSNGEKTFDVGIKAGVVICNALGYLLLDAGSNLNFIEKGGVIALLLLVTWALWKMVQSKDKTIKENYEARIQDKDKEIQNLKDLLNRK